MEKIDNIQKYEIYVDSVPISGTTDFYFFHKDGSKNKLPENDFHIPIFLKRTNEVYEYIDIEREDKIDKIERQEVNPYFIEFGFFDTIKRNRVNHGGELTYAMLNFIRIRRPDVANLSTNELRKWFDDVGVNEFPWNEGTNSETTIDDIDGVNFVSGHIVSSGKFFNIDINK